MKTLVVAEKPSVGKDIARVLQCRQKGTGYLYGETHVVSWAIGHLATLLEPEDYDPEYKKWRMTHLPIIPETMYCKAIPQTKAQLIVLSKLMKSRDIGQIICATDSGREGELIFRYIYQLVDCKKPFKRLWISSMTDTAIREGFNRLKDGQDYDKLYRSARCRAEADWLVGMNASRAYTLQYGTLLSIGRVQTPTLSILVERQREINAFVPMDYWQVKVQFLLSEGKEYTGLWFEMVKPGEKPEDEKDAANTKILDRAKAEAIAYKVCGVVQATSRAAKIKHVTGSGTTTGVIERVTWETKRQLPPQLFDLTELQRECNRLFHFSAQKTLTLAQALYEKHKLITYPRTDSRYLSHDMIPKLTQAVKALDTEPYHEAVSYVLGLEKLPITNRLVDDAKVTDHHAILPTGKKMPPSLPHDEHLVYDRIVRKFLAAFYPAYVYRVTTVITRVLDEYFISKGQVVTDEGWMALYRSEKQSPANPDEDGPLPELTQNETVAVKGADVWQKKTQPPKAYTEATLLSAMEHAGRFVDDEALKEKLKDSGLGTPATRAAIIERLIAVGYLERKNKQLAPTEKGMKLIEVVPKELRSPETTGKWEKGLARIAKGEMDDARFMESIKKYVRYIVDCAAAGDADVKRDLFPKEEPAWRKDNKGKPRSGDRRR